MYHKDLWLKFPSHLPLPAIRSLSLLCIIEEFIIGFDRIQSFLNTAKTNPSSIVECQKFLKFFSIGSYLPQTGMFPDKLCFYSDILQNASNIENNSIQEELHGIRKQVLDLRAQWIQRKKNLNPLGKISTLSPMLHSIKEKLSNLFLSFIPFLSEAKTDENVLLSLIENRHGLNEILSPYSVEKILQAFFPNGHAHLKATIYEGFLRRGFSTFLSEKDRLIEEIEWDNMKPQEQENEESQITTASLLL